MALPSAKTPTYQPFPTDKNRDKMAMAQALCFCGVRNKPYMADDKSKKGPADRERINVHEDYELRYWTDHFGVSADRLRAAVEKVGVMVKDVAKELNH